MEVKQTMLTGVIIFEPKFFSDERGFFLETWSMERYARAGVKEQFVQDNISFSKKGVLRGLHYQHPAAQGKLVQALTGQVFDVAVDIRTGSPTFGWYVSVLLCADRHNQMYIPPGFAHGFCVVSESAIFSYKCTAYYNAPADGGIVWNDPDIGIEWPVSLPVLSAKDSRLLRLRDIRPERLPHYEG